MGGMSWIHWIVVLLIVVLVFGTKKLRNIGQDLGGAVKGFKDGIKEGSEAAAAKPADNAALEQSAQQPPASGGQTIDVEVKK